LRLKILEKLRTASLNSEFTGFYKKKSATAKKITIPEFQYKKFEKKLKMVHKQYSMPLAVDHSYNHAQILCCLQPK